MSQTIACAEISFLIGKMLRSRNIDYELLQTRKKTMQNTYYTKTQSFQQCM